MNTQELIDELKSHHDLLCDGDWHLLRAGLYIEAAQALTASQERERVLRWALEMAAERLKIVADIGSYKKNSPIVRPWELEARQALQSTEQQG